jgi:hypothetical protein
MREVPRLAAVALFQPGEHELRSHGAIGDERPLAERLE